MNAATFSARFRRGVAAAWLAALCLAATPGRAAPGQGDDQTLARAGAWEAFSATAEDGTAICGMDTALPGGRELHIKHFADEGQLVLQLFNPDWDLDADDEAQVAIEFDHLGPWQAQGSGEDEQLDIDIPLDRVTDFLGEFARAKAYRIRFPGEDEPEWRGSLDGSATVLEAFNGCLKAQPAPARPRAPGPGIPI